LNLLTEPGCALLFIRLKADLSFLDDNVHYIIMNYNKVKISLINFLGRRMKRCIKEAVY
jgi:hypothetical protein